jgi:hypothetical protein
MILNSTENFVDLQGYVKDAFQQKFGRPTKDLLPGGMRLYKFNEYPSLHASDTTNLSPWWSPYAPYKHDAGWDSKVKMAKANGISVREWGRLTSAVKENWNSLEFLLEITLKNPVYGFFGGFAQMLRIDPGTASKVQQGEGRAKGSKNLPGGATQFFIPNLKAEHVASWRVSKIDG